MTNLDEIWDRRGEGDVLADTKWLVDRVRELYEALNAFVDAEGNLHAGLLEGPVVANARAALAKAKGEST
jgi:hypothetical protein